MRRQSGKPEEQKRLTSLELSRHATQAAGSIALHCDRRFVVY